MKNIIIIVSAVLFSTTAQAEIKTDNPGFVKEIQDELSNPILAESTVKSELSIDEPKLMKTLAIKEVAEISEKKPLFLKNFMELKKK